jgi:stage II sporulation protein D
MIKKIILCLILIAPMVTTMDGGLIDVISTFFTRQLGPLPPSVRVLLAHDEPKAIIEVKGKYHIFDPRTGAHIESNFREKRRAVEATNDGIRWGEVFTGVYQIQIVPDTFDVTTVVNGVEYRGIINIYDVGGSISIVNVVDLEEYLRETLPQYYTTPLSPELMAAVVIAERTDTYYLTKSDKNPYWDVDASKVGYKGWILSPRSKEIDKALRETKYMVLVTSPGNGWVTAPISVQWRSENKKQLEVGKTYSKITIQQAEGFADRGSNAVQLLEKAFPGTMLQQIYEGRNS